MNILYLAHRIPYPPNKGDKIRSWNELRYLAARHTVHLGCLADAPEDLTHVTTLRPLVESLEVAPLAPRRARLASLAALATGGPLSVRYFASTRLRRYVESVLSRGRLDAVLVFSSPMAAYVWDVPLPRVMDFCDVDSDKWSQYAKRAPHALRPVYALEARRLRLYEKAILERFDAATLVTPREKALWSGLPSGLPSHLLDKVHVVPNGVDLEYFAPGQPRPAPPRDPYALVFTGAMDYYANVDAVAFFAEEVLPLVQRAVPQATFYIVGSRPTAAVQALERRPGVVVTGFVEDIRSWYARAAVCVVPLRIARGIQNKMLEAMAMGRPVVASTPAAEGLGALAGEELLVADAPEAWAEAVVGLLRARARAEALGEAARRLVERDYVWERSMRRLEELLSDTVRARESAVQRKETSGVEAPKSTESIPA
jgi:sugar transferase (PEP-CTERM/EpsH1 system associated)